MQQVHQMQAEPVELQTQTLVAAAVKTKSLQMEGIKMETMQRYRQIHFAVEAAVQAGQSRQMLSNDNNDMLYQANDLT